ncbi:MAG TPA: hypothetical protein VJ224_03210, partial [Thermoplasmata archaeon]|nr:hypothetical protein [Thermoplasmata archaeon]
MEPLTQQPRPARAIVAMIALGLALTAAMVVLQPSLTARLGLAGNAEYGAILGFGPEQGTALLGIEPDAREMASGTRSTADAARAPADPSEESVDTEVEPMAGETSTTSGGSDGGAGDAPIVTEPEGEIQTYEAASAAERLKPATIEDRGDPITTV